MESPLHRENILRDEYTEIGVAAVEGEYKGYDTVYIVQLFGTPAVQASARHRGSCTTGNTCTRNRANGARGRRYTRRA